MFDSSDSRIESLRLHVNICDFLDSCTLSMLVSFSEGAIQIKNTSLTNIMTLQSNGIKVALIPKNVHSCTTTHDDTIEIP